MTEKPKVIIFLALLCVIWGTTWLVTKTNVHLVPPYFAGMLRFALASLILGAIHWRWPAPSALPPPWWLSMIVGSLQLGLSYCLIYYASARLPSALVSVLWATFPLMTMACSAIALPGERFSTAQFIGLGLGLAGVGILVGVDLRGISADAARTGAVFLLSPLLAAMSTVVARRWGKATNAVLLNRNGMALGAMWFAGASIVARESWRLDSVSSEAWISLVYLAVVATVVPFWIYFWLLQRMSAVKLSTVMYITPFIAILTGGFLGREPIHVSTVLGAAILVSGVVLTSRSGANRSMPR
ncbi:MAG TPA: DMT family transporter [Thermoanaerobaculia bacterium]|nr:DMT family transporter [Thermoanaerobaculia bacterium]